MSARRTPRSSAALTPPTPPAQLGLFDAGAPPTLACPSAAPSGAKHRTTRVATPAPSPPAHPASPARPTSHKPRSRYDALPDVRDGLTRAERVLLVTIAEIERERPGRDVPSAMIYGRLAGRLDLTPDEMQAMLARLGARRYPGG